MAVAPYCGLSLLAGLPGQTGLEVARDVILAVIALRVIIVGLAVANGKIAWTRIAAPAIALCALIISMMRISPSGVRASVAAFEALVLGLICASIIRLRNRADDRVDALQRELERFFPSVLAKVAATELMLCSIAYRAPLLVIRGTTASATSYVDGSRLKALVLALPLLVLPELFVDHFVLPRMVWWLPLMLDIASIYVVLMLWGMFASMVDCEHVVSSGAVVFKNGIMKRVSVEPGSIEEVELADEKAVGRQRGTSVTTADLSVRGVPSVRLALCKDAELHSLGRYPRKVREIIAPSDKPLELVKRLSTLG